MLKHRKIKSLLPSVLLPSFILISCASKKTAINVRPCIIDYENSGLQCSTKDGTHSFIPFSASDNFVCFDSADLEEILNSR